MASATSVFGNVLIGGGTGFIGQHIVEALRNIGVRVTIVSRMPGNDTISWQDLREKGIPPNTKSVINVAGQNVLDPRRQWTPGFKQNVVSSRVNTTRTFAEAIIDSKDRPKVFVTISGVGYYKPSQTEEYTEESSGGDHDFLSNLCRDWEEAAKIPKEYGVRTVTIRSGVVLGKYGGLIKNIFIPFYFGFGGPIGDGKQYMPWIHIDDLTRLFLFAIEEERATGIINGVAPDIITNREFTKAVGRCMWRPTIIPLPVAVLNFLFSPERAKMMTEGQKVKPEKAFKLGYEFLYPKIDSALKSIFKF